MFKNTSNVPSYYLIFLKITSTIPSYYSIFKTLGVSWKKFKFHGEAKAWWWQAGEGQWLARHRFGETDIKARKTMSIDCVGKKFATVRPRLCCFTATAVVQRLLQPDLKYGKRYVRCIALF